MRGALLALLLLAAGAVLVPASVADSPARARAQASIVAGSLGDFGTLTASGDAERSDGDITVEDSGVVIGAAEAVARASRAGGRGSARAAALARRVDLFDGLVTARLARRTATATAGGVVSAGRISGLSVEGRTIGDVRKPGEYPLSDGGSVVVNRARAAIRVTLGAPRGEAPAGTTVEVAVAVASARDQVVATPTPTPTPTATPKPKPKAKPRAARRRRAPKVRERLTGQRYAFPVYGEASVADDFGAPRQIGAHEGNDVFAPFGAPVLAVADGVVERVGTLPISGNRLWLRTGAGDAFFYAHLSAFSPDAVNGRKVRAGTVLGFTGNTGDAEPTPPHVHFEIHPGGKDAIDPHAILLAWQANRDVPPGAWLARHGADTAERPGALVEVRDFIAGE